MRSARTGWPGTHGPWRVCLAMSGHALEDGLEAAEAGEVAEDSVEFCGWRREGWSAACNGQGPYVLGRLALGRDRPRGNGKCLALAPRRMMGVRDDHSDSPSGSHDGRAGGCRPVR